MAKPKELEGLVTMTEAAKELNILKPTLEFYWVKGLIKPVAIKLMGVGTVINDPEIVNNPEKLKELGVRYQFYFDSKFLFSRVKKIKELQQKKRFSIKEIQEFFGV
jgi:DNA-binding transcriptional MerR regulator